MISTNSSCEHLCSDPLVSDATVYFSISYLKCVFTRKVTCNKSTGNDNYKK